MTHAEYARFVDAWCARTCSMDVLAETSREMSACAVAGYKFGLELRMSLTEIEHG